MLLAQPADSAFKAYDQAIPGTQFRFKMVPISAGKFLMGSSNDKAARKDEGPQRSITISPFWMGAFEVTHDEFDFFFQDEAFAENSKLDAVTRPTPQYIDLSWGMGKSGGFPANSMQQFTALMYCRWLYQKTGQFFRLPTEADFFITFFIARLKNKHPFSKRKFDVIAVSVHHYSAVDAPAFWTARKLILCIYQNGI